MTYHIVTTLPSPAPPMLRWQLSSEMLLKLALLNDLCLELRDERTLGTGLFLILFRDRKSFRGIWGDRCPPKRIGQERLQHR
jgi:hypothetical protein